VLKKITLLRDRVESWESYPFCVPAIRCFEDLSLRSRICFFAGENGTGKSTLLETMIRQDIQNGNGVCLIDPHGDLAQKVLLRIPENRRHDLIYFNVPDTAHPLHFNPLGDIAPSKRALTASNLISIFKTQWADNWGPRSEYIMRNCLLALLEMPSAQLSDITRLFSDKTYRQEVANAVTNPPVRNFWLREFESFSPRFRVDATAPLQNKLGAFLSNPIIAGIVGSDTSSFDLREVMDSGKILIVNLAKGQIGEDTTGLLGAFLVSSITLSALGRADVSQSQRRFFGVYLDEFQSYTTLSLASALSELRKYGISITLCHQYIHQLEKEVYHAILGNVGSLIAFRVGVEDAKILTKEFEPELELLDLVNLPNHNIYIRLLVDGVPRRPFSAETIMLNR